VQWANEKSWRKIAFEGEGFGHFNIYHQFKIRANIYISIAAGSYCPFDHPLKVINSFGDSCEK